MTYMMQRARWKTLAAVLVAGLLVFATACGDDDPENNEENNSNSEADAGDENNDEDAGDENNDEDGGDENNDEEGLTELNIDTEGEIVEDEDGSWIFSASSEDQSQFVQVGLTDEQGAEGESVDLESGENFEDDNLALFLDGETIYMATSGTLEVDTLEEDGGDFEARLVDNELIEVEISQEDGSISEVSDGLTGGFDEASLSGAVVPWVDFDPSCDIEDFEAADETMQAAAGEGTISMSAATSEDEPNDLITVFLSENTEDTFEIDDFRLTDCTNCGILDKECTTTEEGLECEKTFMAGAGEVEVTETGSVDDQLTATLRDAEFAEAEVDYLSGETRLVEDGEGWCIDELQFEATIEEQDTGG